jgi:hypothetical protein
VNGDGATARELRRLGVGNVVSAGDAAALHDAVLASSTIPAQRRPFAGVQSGTALHRFAGVLQELGDQ